MIDEIRRVLTETVIPYITQNKDKMKKKVQDKIKNPKGKDAKEGKVMT
jgi:hypothetical protein